MGIFIVIVFLALSSWAFIALVRRLRRERVSTAWWLGFGTLATVGVALGVWCAFHFEYHLGSRYRVGSFPIPIVFFHLEDGQCRRRSGSWHRQLGLHYQSSDWHNGRTANATADPRGVPFAVFADV